MSVLTHGLHQITQVALLLGPSQKSRQLIIWSVSLGNLLILHPYFYQLLPQPQDGHTGQDLEEQQAGDGADVPSCVLTISLPKS